MNNFFLRIFAEKKQILKNEFGKIFDLFILYSILGLDHIFLFSNKIRSLKKEFIT